MRLDNNKYNIVRMMKVGVLLPLSFLVPLLVIWSSSVRSLAEDINSPSEIEDTKPMGELNRNEVQGGQPRNTETFSPLQRDSQEVIPAPLGTEMSIEELRCLKEATIKDSWFMHPFLYSNSKMQTLETLGSGIEGQVTVRPISPVERPKMVNEHPYQATITVLDRADQIVTQFQSDVDGYFRVRLDPGIYTLRPESPKALPYAKKQTVTVCKMKFTQVQIFYDSGIR